MRSASTSITCWEVSERTCSGTSGEASSRTQRAAARAVTSSASSMRAAGSATRLACASRTSTLPRMSAAFHADRFAPSWEITQSAAPSRSIQPTWVASSTAGAAGSR